MAKTLKIATWNINSVRFRLGIVEKFLQEEAPDILCLQETKTVDETFPAEPLRAIGYEHQLLCGQPMHHGVAIVSKVPLNAPESLDWQANGEARHIAARLDCGFRLDNVYVPAGGDIPDREQNPKFGQKLDFLARMTKWSKKLDEPALLVGDFNVAPLEADVWSHKQLLKVVSHTPIEVETLGKLQTANDWVDLGREFIPAPERYFSWWSYRAKDWAKSDRGRRLDHMWASPEVAEKAIAHTVHEPIRGWLKPSDHVPLVTEFRV
jgi:exodeoxyribonuclease-3